MNRVILAPICGLMLLLIGCSNPHSLPQNQPTLTNRVQPNNVSTPVPSGGNPSVSKNLLTENGTFRMISSSTGWSFTSLPGSPMQGNSILRSNDGGQTWKSTLLPESLSTSTIFAGGLAFDSATAWFATSDSNNTSIWRTTDGSSWTPTNISNPYTITEFSFPDRSHGWLLASPGPAAGQEPIAVFKTNDGGKTWSNVYSTGVKSDSHVPLIGVKTGISFIDQNTGWISIDNGDSKGQISLYVTHDGGHSWSLQRLIVPSTLKNSYARTEPPIFTSSKLGVLPVVFSGQRTVFYVTHDSGVSWEPTSIVPMNSVIKISVTDASTMWTTDGADVFMTGDKWTQWTSWKAPLDQGGKVVDILASDSKSVTVYALEDQKIVQFRLTASENKIVQK